MKLVVGLGNPGNDYNNTRHNVGFRVLNHYLGSVNWQDKFNGKIYINENTIYLLPQTYMNLSGESVIKVVNFYKIDINDILVIQDDLDIELGKYKIKRNSSSGGHNGIKSITELLKSDSFARLKIGIGKDKNIPTDKYVLGKFSNEEQDILNLNKNIYNEIIDTFNNYDIEEVMKRYN